MRDLIVPKRLRAGDTVALISISGGRAGDPDMLARYETGKTRLEEIFSVKVIETPHALMGSQFIYEHPEKRAEDLMWALENDEVKGIICNMGGCESYRVLPYIDPQVIHDNPKVFMGFSDIASWMAVFMYAGVRAYYGPNVLGVIAQPGGLDKYTEEAIRKTLFSDEVIGEIKPCEKYTATNWTATSADEIDWTENTGYKVLQGTGKVQGRLISVCGGPLWQIMGSKYYPSKENWEDSIISIEHGMAFNSESGFTSYHQLSSYAASGAFDKAKAILTDPLNEKMEEILLKVINTEIGRSDMVIIENVDFIHRIPMTILPTGALTEIDCDKKSITILESGCR